MTPWRRGVWPSALFSRPYPSTACDISFFSARQGECGGITRIWKTTPPCGCGCRLQPNLATLLHATYHFSQLAKGIAATLLKFLKTTPPVGVVIDSYRTSPTHAMQYIIFLSSTRRMRRHNSNFKTTPPVGVVFDSGRI